MTEKDAPKSAFAKGPPATGEDLSDQIERAIGKDPQDRVRCVRVFEDYYRCNWWAPAVSGPGAFDKSYNWGVLTTHHVRRSCFLNATMDSGQLVMKEVRGAVPPSE